MNKTDKQNAYKCKTCQFYNKQNNVCTLSDKDKCNNTNFSKCNSYLILDKLINY